MSPALLADLIVAVHLGIVLFVLLGLVAVVVGGLAGWSWVRNPWFRWIHLAVIAFVAIQGALGRICPLTTWEVELRRAAEQEVQEGTFVGRLMRDLLYVDVPQTTLNFVYIAFAGLVVLSFWLVRPRPWRTR